MGVIFRSPGSRYWEVFWSLTKVLKKLPLSQAVEALESSFGSSVLSFTLSMATGLLYWDFNCRILTSNLLFLLSKTSQCGLAG